MRDGEIWEALCLPAIILQVFIFGNDLALSTDRDDKYIVTCLHNRMLYSLENELSVFTSTWITLQNNAEPQSQLWRNAYGMITCV